MEALISQFKCLASSADEATRIALIDFAVQIQYSLEAPADMLQRVGFAVRLLLTSFSSISTLTNDQATQTYVAESAIELGIFEIIAGAKEPVSDKEIAEKIGVDACLVGNVLWRHLIP
jgi:hypothetical protein